MNFVVSIKVDEEIPRKDFRETIEALVKELKNPKLTKFSIQLIKKVKGGKGKMDVQVFEFPLTKK